MYRDIHTCCVDRRKDKEMELEVLSADIQNWEGEVRFSLSAHIPTLFKDHKLSSRGPNIEAV